MRTGLSARWSEGGGAPLVGGVLLLGAALTLSLAYRLVGYEQAEAERESRIGADEIASAIQRRIDAHAEVLHGLSGLIHSAGDSISRERFRRYVERWNPRQRLGAMQAVQFVRVLEEAELPIYERAVKADALLPATLREGFKVQPATAAPYYVIDSTEPLAGNERVVGFNLGSRPTHRAALERGRDTGRLVATERVNLIQDPSGAPAFVMRLPVYRGEQPPTDVSSRRAALLGFVAVVYRVGHLVEGLIDASMTERLRLVLHDAGFDEDRRAGWRPGADSLMYDSERDGAADLAGALRRELRVGDRRWELYLLPKAGAPGGQSTSLIVVGLGGALITLLAASLALAWARSRATARRLGLLTIEQSVVFDNALAGIVQVRDRRIHRCNERFAAILGYASTELAGRTPSDLFPSAQAHAAFEAEARARYEAGQPLEFELALRARDGREVWCAMHGRSHRFGDQRESIWVIEDLSTRRAAAEQLAAQNAAVAQANAELQRSVASLSEQKRRVELLGNMSTTLQSCQSSDEVAEVLERGFLALNAGLGGSLFLLDPSSGLLHPCRRWGGAAAAPAAPFAPQDCWALRRSRPHISQGLALHCSHGSVIEGTLCLPLLAMNEQVGLLCVNTAADQDEALQTVISTAAEQIAVTLVNLRMRERLHDQAIRDKLTGLCNRRFLDESLQRELARCRREAGSLSLLLIDVDHFKRFNDQYGHELGDQVLAAVGRCLATQTRATDLPCRYGGEEFVVAMPRSSLEDATERAEALREAIASIPLASGGQSLQITASIGVAGFPQHGPEPAQLLAAADAALYEAKRAGRNRVVRAS